MAFLQGIVGQPTNRSAGGMSAFTFRGGQMSDLIVSELQGRFYENNYQGNLFSGSTGTVNALAAATITTVSGTTPILGAWNPTTSTVNLVMLQAVLHIHNIATAAVDPAAFVWAVSLGNGALTGGNSPFNRKTLASSGSQAKDMSFVGLAGLTNNLVVKFTSAFGAFELAPAAGVVGMPVVGQYENFDGSLIVPPGGVLALLNTTSTTTVSVAGTLLWAEVPI
jgi:hypothetical protein